LLRIVALALPVPKRQNIKLSPLLLGALTELAKTEGVPLDLLIILLIRKGLDQWGH
jgi:hypothetical protein